MAPPSTPPSSPTSFALHKDATAFAYEPDTLRSLVADPTYQQEREGLAKQGIRVVLVGAKELLECAVYRRGTPFSPERAWTQCLLLCHPPAADMLAQEAAARLQQAFNVDCIVLPDHSTAAKGSTPVVGLAAPSDALVVNAQPVANVAEGGAGATKAASVERRVTSDKPETPEERVKPNEAAHADADSAGRAREDQSREPGGGSHRTPSRSAERESSEAHHELTVELKTNDGVQLAHAAVGVVAPNVKDCKVSAGDLFFPVQHTVRVQNGTKLVAAAVEISAPQKTKSKVHDISLRERSRAQLIGSPLRSYTTRPLSSEQAEGRERNWLSAGLVFTPVAGPDGDPYRDGGEVLSLNGKLFMLLAGLEAGKFNGVPLRLGVLVLLSRELKGQVEILAFILRGTIPAAFEGKVRSSKVQLRLGVKETAVLKEAHSTIADPQPEDEPGSLEVSKPHHFWTSAWASDAGSKIMSVVSRAKAKGSQLKNDEKEAVTREEEVQTP